MYREGVEVFFWDQHDGGAVHPEALGLDPFENLVGFEKLCKRSDYMCVESVSLKGCKGEGKYLPSPD